MGNLGKYVEYKQTPYLVVGDRKHLALIARPKVGGIYKLQVAVKNLKFLPYPQIPVIDGYLRTQKGRAFPID